MEKKIQLTVKGRCENGTGDQQFYKKTNDGSEISRKKWLNIGARPTAIDVSGDQERNGYDVVVVRGEREKIGIKEHCSEYGKAE